MSWIKSSIRCGIHLTNVDLDIAGTWKCHLADTSLTDVGGKIRLFSIHQFLFNESRRLLYGYSY